MNATRQRTVTLFSLTPPLDRLAVRRGVADMAVPLIGIAIWGLVTGVAMVNGGLTVPLAMVLSLLSYAGSAQLAVLPLLRAHAPLPVVLATAMLVNLRFVIFSAAARRFFCDLGIRQRLASGYLLGDVGSALFLRRYNNDPVSGDPQQWGYYYGVGVSNLVVWHVASVVGILVGNAAPSSWGLDLAALLALSAVLIPMIVRRPIAVGVAVTAALSVLSARLPMKLGLLLSVVIGIASAMMAESIGGSAGSNDASKPVVLSS